MSSFHSWKSGAAAVMALAITAGATAPMINPAPVLAQYQGQYRATIPSGTRIPVRYERSQKVVVTPDETAPLTLRVATDVTNRNGAVLIPAGTQVVGELQPARRNSQKGTRFVARELVFNSGQRQNIDATSRVIPINEHVGRGVDAGNILKGAAAGAGAATVLSAISGGGRVPLGAILGGGGAGAIGGAILGKKTADVVVIRPDTDLSLTLRSSLPVRYY